MTPADFREALHAEIAARCTGGAAFDRTTVFTSAVAIFERALQEHDARVTELLAANTAAVERRRSIANDLESTRIKLYEAEQRAQAFREERNENALRLDRVTMERDQSYGKIDKLTAQVTSLTSQVDDLKRNQHIYLGEIIRKLEARLALAGKLAEAVSLMIVRFDEAFPPTSDTDNLALRRIVDDVEEACDAFFLRGEPQKGREPKTEPEAAPLMTFPLYRLSERALINLLDAPCLWCDYKGEGYWQTGTHAALCPLHAIGGDRDREEWLRSWMDRPGMVVSLHLAAAIDPEDDGPHRVATEAPAEPKAECQEPLWSEGGGAFVERCWKPLPCADHPAAAGEIEEHERLGVRRAGKDGGASAMRKPQLNERSAWLLRYAVGLLPLGVSATARVPLDAPAGVGMSTVRGLQRIGLLEERVAGVFYATDTARALCRELDGEQGKDGAR